MYTIVLAALLTTGNDVPDFGRRGGCRGCWGGCYGGCWGGCWGGCYGGCYGGGGYGGCYGGYWGCYGCGGGCYGCGGGTVIYSSGGCTGMASGGGGGSSRRGGSASGGGGGSEELSQNLQELKRSLEQLKKQQTDIRIETLKTVAEELKLKATEQKIDELRRNVEELRRRLPPPPGAVPVPGPQPRPVLPAPQPGKGEVLLDLPADALILVNEKRVETASVFLTPMLQPEQEYTVNVEAVIVRDGKSISRVKQLALHAGEVVRLAYDDMEPAAGRWVRIGQKTAAPAHITVRLPADARLTVQGVECPLTSETRTFDTPVLTPGKAYTYVLRAEVMRDGRPLAQTQRITFRSGERVRVSFDKFDAQSVASR